MPGHFDTFINKVMICLSYFSALCCVCGLKLEIKPKIQRKITETSWAELGHTRIHLFPLQFKSNCIVNYSSQLDMSPKIALSKNCFDQKLLCSKIALSENCSKKFDPKKF